MPQASPAARRSQVAAQAAQASEPVWKHLNLNMAAPRIFARPFTKAGFRLY